MMMLIMTIDTERSSGLGSRALWEEADEEGEEEDEGEEEGDDEEKLIPVPATPGPGGMVSRVARAVGDTFGRSLFRVLALCVIGSTDLDPKKTAKPTETTQTSAADLY